ncbi:hypothetical protein VOLCADRAFT_106162 [Volvox carteri f. nagariensis]|uniref:Protein kinase domain-containing protein n=1 Tax=Volvox carteri f. nagariensis TaxID=3068 RepID=D8U5I3_VOLCA|nr:uncharacterized protein VOLCADRAFT_106162 [Volvox carteri f. nagariensis]EFJ44925.1 hypothetical protein VOLCADRAFT_106162 [Volvox carteri f. nagariensis]|eukprot:XP_002953896.1 hypothetical protein VOLCADRAFT_106162 [Volvox carteri f. nagariensis]
MTCGVGGLLQLGEAPSAAEVLDVFSTASTFRLRWFTPTCEVPCCGHATLASAAVLMQARGNPHPAITFHTLSGELVVRYCGRGGLNYVLMVLEEGQGLGRRELEELQPDLGAMLSAAAAEEVHGVIVCVRTGPARGGAAQTEEGEEVCSRFFAPWMGINEDPVTGSAHAVLGPYWEPVLRPEGSEGAVEGAGQGGSGAMRMRQCSARGGEVMVEVLRKQGRVHVSGMATLVLEGTLRLEESWIACRLQRGNHPQELSAFHVESLLGGGGFSHVVLARDSAGKEWALKLIPAPGAKCLDEVDSTPLLLSEARIHLLLSSEPSVLPCVEAFKSCYVDERDTRITTYMAVLQMPVAACSVEEWLFSASPMPQPCQGPPQSQVDEMEVLSVWLQMVNAVHRCHAHGIVHKDIKLPNFLMDNRGKVQIMDFGLAHVEGVTPRAVAGTPWTMSPAGLRHGDDGRAGDWWALGVVLYQLLQGGAWPFKQCWWPWQKGSGERMEAAIRRAVLAGRITFPQGARVSEPIKALIRGLLQPDPNRRWQLRQVLACEVVRPELLSKLADRFPELAIDMQALMQLQRRARDVQALGSDGGNAAAAAVAGLGLASAGSVIAAAATSVVNRARGVSALVGEGGLHWPHWGPGSGRGEPGVADGGSYRPLLDGEDREESEPARRSGPWAPLSSALVPRRSSADAVAIHPGAPQRAAQQAGQQIVQHAAEGMRVADLLLLFPDEVPDAHPSSPGIPKVEQQPPPQASRSAAPPGLASVPSEPGAAGPLSTTSAGAATAADAAGAIRHANTASIYAHTGPSDVFASGRFVEAEGKRDGSGSQHPSPRLSRRSLTGPQLSPGSRRYDHTSLHDLFGVHSGSHPLQPLPLQHHRAMSGAGFGGPLSAAVATDVFTGNRSSWAAPRGAPLWHHQPGSDGRNSEGPESTAMPPPSSWVPPPPEAFAAGTASRLGDMSSRTRSSMASSAGAAGQPIGETGHTAGAGTPDVPGTAHQHVGFLAKARRLFSDCLQRPGVKYDAYDYDELEAMPASGKAS